MRRSADLRCKESVPIATSERLVRLPFIGSTYVRHCGIQPSFALRHRADAGCAGTARRDRRARRRRRRLRVPGPGDTYATVVKQRTPASQLLERVVRARRGEPAARPRARLHEGPSRRSPRTTIRCATGRWSGSTTGSSLNDDELLAPHSCARAEPRMTVDSEAIFALAAHSRNDAHALEQLRGAMATAWLDEREPGVVFLARGSGRPLWARRGPRRRLLRLDQGSRSRSSSATAALKLRKREVREGTWLALEDGEVARRAALPARRLDYLEDHPLPVGARAAGAASSASRASRRSPPPRGPLSRPSRRPRRSRLPRAAARARGTGTSPTRRGAPRTGGRPATR